jgi:pyrimidine operon attenuation protein/uracil phosphoribosyltransferase
MKRVILKQKDISDSIHRIATEIVTKNGPMENVVLVGIRTGGAYLAIRLREILAERHGYEIPIGVLDITLYRDDWKRIGPTPIIGKTDLPFTIDEKTVILVDDVLFTGRTVRAAMDALIDYGRPKRIELAILLDRGDNDRELPITANYVGRVLKIPSHETIHVCLEEAGFEDQVVVEEKKAA